MNHVISIADKIKLEAPFHKLHDAGHISYVELTSAPTHNPEAIMKIVEYAFDQDAGYVGINFPIDECPTCYKHEIIPSDCSKCGTPSEMIRRVRRVTGYLSSTDRFGDGKIAELKARTIHN